MRMADGSSPEEAPLTRAEQAKQLKERARWVRSQNITNIATFPQVLATLSQTAGQDEEAFQAAVRALSRGSTLPEVLDGLQRK